MKHLFGKTLAALTLGVALLGTTAISQAKPFDGPAGKFRHQQNHAIKDHQKAERDAARYNGGYGYNNGGYNNGGYSGGYGNGGYYGNGGHNNGGYSGNGGYNNHERAEHGGGHR